MHKYFGMAFFVTSMLTGHASLASEMISIDQLLTETDPLQKLEGLKAQNPENFKKLCDAINDSSFYGKAEQAKVGVIKRNKLINVCQTESMSYEQKAVNPTVQKSQKAASGHYCSVSSINKSPIVTENHCIILSAEITPQNQCHIVVQNCIFGSKNVIPKPLGVYTEVIDQRLEKLKMELRIINDKTNVTIFAPSS